MTKEDYMRRALKLARQGAGYTNPNPMVGCVVVKDGRIISEGYHEKYGEFHAERNALTRCVEDPAGADLYVTLEPCCHYGKTPPCTEIIIEKKIARVFVGSMDSNPLVAGKGVQILREAGIEVETGILAEECRKLNEVFYHYMETGLPFVAMKYAMSLDGKIACATGDSKWVTGEAARRHVHELRKQYMGIMVGIGTVLADDPMLNCRVAEGADPVRIVCDSQLRIPMDSRLVQTARQIPTIVACGGNIRESESLKKKAPEVRSSWGGSAADCGSAWREPAAADEAVGGAEDRQYPAGGRRHPECIRAAGADCQQGIRLYCREADRRPGSAEPGFRGRGVPDVRGGAAERDGDPAVGGRYPGDRVSRKMTGQRRDFGQEVNPCLRD